MNFSDSTTHSLPALPKRVTIIGAARSGIAAAQYLADRGVELFMSDSCPAEALEITLASNNLVHIPHEAGKHTDAALHCDCIVLSPGVPSDLSILKKAHKKGIPVISEIELAFQQSTASYLAVTGSSGKSTTVSMLGCIVQAAAVEHVVAGNIGLPLIGTAPSLPKEGVVVAEISSFQLENIQHFKPRVACIINLMKNHLDRYPSEEAYYNAKKNIARNIDKGDFLVVNAKDPLLFPWALSEQSKTRVAFFGAAVEGFPSVWYENGVIYSSFEGSHRPILDVGSMKVDGRHNYENASAAAAIACAYGIGYAAIAEGLAAFKSLSHRLEFVTEVNGVRYYNDSKSTTAESVLCAVQAFQDNVILIAGGRDKGCEFSIVNAAIKAHVRQVILIGEAAERISKVWNGLVPIRIAESMADAVSFAETVARPGDVVVLSPGCASFDMFSDFEDRGRSFCSLVRGLSVMHTPNREQG